MNIVETESGVYSVIADGVSYEVRALGDQIVVNGHYFDLRRRMARSVPVSGPARILSPMPGKVVRVLVAVGEEVTSGRGIVVVEAMKMQNELKSPRDGIVTSIGVRENDSVTAGALLAVIE